jgi:hypothetical protein
METALQSTDLPITFVKTIPSSSPLQNFNPKDMPARILSKVVSKPGSAQEMQQLSQKMPEYLVRATIQPDLLFRIFLAEGVFQHGIHTPVVDGRRRWV